MERAHKGGEVRVHSHTIRSLSLDIPKHTRCIQTRVQRKQMGTFSFPNKANVLTLCCQMLYKYNCAVNAAVNNIVTNAQF